MWGPLAGQAGTWPGHRDTDSRDMGAAAAGLTWSKGHICFLQNTECIQGGSTPVALPGGHRIPGPLSQVPTPHHSWPFAVLLEKGTSLSEVSPSPAQGTWPTYWPEGGSRKISPFRNHEDPDLRTPSLAALRSGRLGLGSYVAGGPTSS